MQFIKQEHGKFDKNKYSEFILAGDIGGTSISLGIFGIKKNISELIVSFKFKSSEVKILPDAINQVLDSAEKTDSIKISKACFGAAGIVSQDKQHAKIKKLSWNLSSDDISEKTKLKKIIFINDFEAVGYGICIIKNNQLIKIKRGIKIPKSNILAIGAGTGLGKTLLVYDEHKKAYIPIASEAGHINFPAQTREEFKLAEFIKKRKKIKCGVSYEQVLSGKGLSNIYLFLRKSRKFANTKYTKEIDASSCSPELISKYRKADRTCKKTFEIFTCNYAKFARDMAIDGLSTGGIYIAGGIAPKNAEIFGKQFIKIFEQSHERAYILKMMPIYLITDYNIGLLGAGFAGAELLK